MILSLICECLMLTPRPLLQHFTLLVNRERWQNRTDSWSGFKLRHPRNTCSPGRVMAFKCPNSTHTTSVPAANKRRRRALSKVPEKGRIRELRDSCILEIRLYARNWRALQVQRRVECLIREQHQNKLIFIFHWILYNIRDTNETIQPSKMGWQFRQM